ncbi:MAG: ATP-grasp domain-containing protein [Candidatus Eutrophobiaceae bacterium]
MTAYAIVSHTARVLVGSALLGPSRVHSLDLFADEDYADRLASRACLQVNGWGGWDSVSLLAQARRLSELEHRCQLHWVWGSGFEAEPRLLDALSEFGSVVGNSAATVARCKEPNQLFPLLKHLNIPFPETWWGVCSDSMLPAGFFLIKAIGGAGGTHIRRCLALPASYDPDRHYIQALYPGESFSAVFLADGLNFAILGYNRQFSSEGGFAFQGAVRLPHVCSRMRATVEAWLGKLVPELGLRGLCGLDFMGSRKPNGEYVLLEINPRPSSSFELHEPGSASFAALEGSENQGWDGSVFAWHIAASQGCLPKLPDFSDVPARSMRIVFAEQAGRVPEGMEWPCGVVNRPKAGTEYRRGEPLCTVLASREGQAYDALRELVRSMPVVCCL